MPSPFPGMDPYLEGEMWQEFHETLANAIRSALISQLRPKYVALLAKRYVLNHPGLGIMQPTERIVYPVVHIVRPAPPAGGRLPTYGGVAVMEPTAEVASPIIEEVPVLSIEVRDVAERRLVTLIEILSPVNKRGPGARDYAQRRLELMQTATHLLELDLLTAGQRIQLLGALPPASYYALLSRTQRRPYTQIYAFGLRTPLPRLPVPLLAPDPDVVLDLQAALESCFELVGYEQLLDYQAPPPSTFSDADQQWIMAQLMQAGFRQRA